MSVELDPPELGFKRPFQQEVSQTLRLKNPHSDPVAFKVKTTAPKQYCVRPNSGRIEPGKDVEVQILLQAMKEDPPLEAKCRDKFLVQSVAVTADKEFTNVASIWSHIEQTAKSSIQEKKIRVTFLPADDVTVTPPKTNGVSHANDRSSMLPSPSPEAVTPQRTSSEVPVGSVSRPESRPAESKSLGEAKGSAHNPAASGVKSTVAAAAAGVTNALPTSSTDLNAQLAEAKATIAKLRQQLSEQSGTGLRQRKTGGGQEPTGKLTTGMGVQQAPAGGVPVQIVAALCLLSFLIAYFLF
ncbi:MSP domain-containing protein [Lindgomyces ingoldianus]|uniref:MSP domain-containing protein n=1 Tax=Lindgomyces ingoldianus TaxID=673940 RepID=A0ACB6QJD8_9PLEO|nr:MSP domain-containing protein [Lindgomyces ingoldianus]KAF2467010.1 MSP domain-containing protein [Lindgomyces ingoldianus]